jgi:hypothetical protein
MQAYVSPMSHKVEARLRNRKTFRLVLELRRLHSLDREAVSYHTGTEKT